MPRFAAVLVLAVALVLGTASYGAVEARRVQTGIATLCNQIPTLLAAVDFTLRTWPPETSGAPAETTTTLKYFTAMVQADQGWCDSNAGVDQPQVVAQTMMWHFGYASETLVLYQAAAHNIPLPTAIPTGLPTALPTALPTSLPTALPTTLPTALPTLPRDR